MGMVDLTLAATRLWAIVEDLNPYILQINAEIKKANPGTSAWVTLAQSTTSLRELGYTKVDKKWGLALRRWEDGVIQDVWLFESAPLYIRLEAIPKIPSLIEHMTSVVDELESLAAKRVDELEQIAREFGVTNV